MGHSMRMSQEVAPIVGCAPELLFSKQAGKIGLRNLGNTCFMNAGLQCLSHLEPLVAFFLTGQYQQELNTSNPRGRGGELAKAFAELQRALWQGDEKVHNPRELHAKLAQFAPHLFEDGEQQDVQEFLAFCLDGLHEDLNRVKMHVEPRTEAQDQADERLVAGRGDEFAAALGWFRHLQREKSFLVDLMQGQLRSSLTCLECGHISRRFDPFLYLSLPVTRGTSSVAGALEKFLEEEELAGEERWRCPHCKTRVDSKKKIDLWKLPPVLVFHLKRFEFEAASQTFRKSDNRLSMKLTLLDLAPFCSSPQRDGAVYDVVCAANHAGEYGSGHYTASCRVGNSSGGEWHYFNDSITSPIGGRSVVTRETYMIFLARHEVPADKPTWLQQVHRRASLAQRVLMRKQSLSTPDGWPYPYDLVKEVLGYVGGASAHASSSDSEVPAVKGSATATATAAGVGSGASGSDSGGSGAAASPICTALEPSQGCAATAPVTPATSSSLRSTCLDSAPRVKRQRTLDELFKR